MWGSVVPFPTGLVETPTPQGGLEEATVLGPPSLPPPFLFSAFLALGDKLRNPFLLSPAPTNPGRSLKLLWWPWAQAWPVCGGATRLPGCLKAPARPAQPCLPAAWACPQTGWGSWAGPGSPGVLLPPRSGLAAEPEGPTTGTSISTSTALT